MGLPSAGLATATAGTSSYPLNLTAAAFNSGTAKSVSENFRWQAEPVGNNTANTGGKLNLLFYSGSNSPTETGLSIASNGQFTFAAGQIFPGTGPGTITGVTAGTDLTGGGTAGGVTLSLDTTKVPQLNAANIFTGNQTVNGNLSATGVVSGGSYQIGSNLFGFGSYKNENTYLGFAGNSAANAGANENTAIGYQVLHADTTGLANTATGAQAMRANTTGTFNVANGTDALGQNTTGSYNVASGSSALYSNTIGINNTAVGLGALSTSITASDSTAIGARALQSNTGAENTAVGSTALESNTTGIGNTATGYQALLMNTAGSHNSAYGYEALYTSGGADNTAAGSQALFSNTSGVDNTANGASALYSNTTGHSNTATGVQALRANTTSLENTADGASALFNNSTGGDNTASGAYALFNNSTGGYNTASGAYALFDNATGVYNTADGVSTLSFRIGSYNTAVGYFALGGNHTITGSLLTCIGYECGADDGVSNATAIGANALVTESNALILGPSSVSVGIGTSAPFTDYALDVETVQSNGIINGGVVVNASGGNLYLGMTSGTHKFRVDTNGVTYSNGGFQSSGADFAESVAVRGERSLYQPGDLMAIAKGAQRTLVLSHTPYSTLVAGIYSTKPGVLATPHSIDEKLDSEVPLAIVGIVPCKVTAENGAIQEGDLLVSSSHPGYAMKGTDRRRMLGAVVGKALEALSAGNGVIQVLVTLQ